MERNVKSPNTAIVIEAMKNGEMLSEDRFIELAPTTRTGLSTVVSGIKYQRPEFGKGIEYTHINGVRYYYHKDFVNADNGAKQQQENKSEAKVSVFIKLEGLTLSELKTLLSNI